jgi:hypothetical protein
VSLPIPAVVCRLVHTDDVAGVVVGKAERDVILIPAERAAHLRTLRVQSVHMCVQSVHVCYGEDACNGPEAMASFHNLAIRIACSTEKRTSPQPSAETDATSPDLSNSPISAPDQHLR